MPTPPPRPWGTTALLKVERGYQGGDDTTMLALAAVAAFVTLGAAAISTGLAITDGQADLETLAAVGARPRVRRTLAGSQASITAAMGAVLGSATGLVPAVAVVEARSHSFRAIGAGGPQDGDRRPRPELPGDPLVVPPRHDRDRSDARRTGAVLVTRSKVEIRRRRG